MNEDQQSISFIKNTLGVQRLADFEDDKRTHVFEWMVELYQKCEKYLQDETNVLLKNKIIEQYNELFDYIYFLREVSPNDVTVSNYHEKKAKQAAQAAATPLVVKEGADGQAKLVMQRGGARKGAGRKKSGKESRTVKVALDPVVWMTVEAIKEIEEIKTMSETLAILIERGLDNDR